MVSLLHPFVRTPRQWVPLNEAVPTRRDGDETLEFECIQRKSESPLTNFNKLVWRGAIRCGVPVSATQSKIIKNLEPLALHSSHKYSLGWQ